MSRNVNRFYQREISRALRAARLAGENVDRVEIDPKSGKISVILAKPGEVQAGNELDSWMEKHADKTARD